MIELISTSLDHTVALGRRLGELCVAGDVIGLDGELGAGKTQLVRGLARGMDLDPTHVSSPTFVFMHEYLPPPPEAQQPSPEDQGHGSATGSDDGLILVHIDAYRVTGPDDLATLGFDDELRDTSVTAVEWATLIATTPGSPLGDHRLHVLIEHMQPPGTDDGTSGCTSGGTSGGGARRITLEPHGRWADRLLLLKNLAPGQ